MNKILTTIGAHMTWRGKEVTKMRVALGMRKSDLARECNVDASLVSYWEKRENEEVFSLNWPKLDAVASKHGYSKLKTEIRRETVTPVEVAAPVEEVAAPATHSSAEAVVAALSEIGPMLDMLGKGGASQDEIDRLACWDTSDRMAVSAVAQIYFGEYREVNLLLEEIRAKVKVLSARKDELASTAVSKMREVFKENKEK